MRIAIGSDHAGYQLKTVIKEFLHSDSAVPFDSAHPSTNAQGGGRNPYEVTDFGTHSGKAVDYPDIGRAVAEAVAAGKFDRGIVICGSGVGMSIAANKVPGIRAVLCTDEYTARISREHNDTNVLALGERTTGVELAKSVVRAWLAAQFDPQSRHAKRVAKLEP